MVELINYIFVSLLPCVQAFHCLLLSLQNYKQQKWSYLISNAKVHLSCDLHTSL